MNPDTNALARIDELLRPSKPEPRSVLIEHQIEAVNKEYKEVAEELDGLQFFGLEQRRRMKLGMRLMALEQTLQRLKKALAEQRQAETVEKRCQDAGAYRSHPHYGRVQALWAAAVSAIEAACEADQRLLDDLGADGIQHEGAQITDAPWLNRYCVLHQVREKRAEQANKNGTGNALDE